MPINEMVIMQSDAGFGEDEVESGEIVSVGNYIDQPTLPEDEPRLSFDEISSPLTAQLLEFCEQDLFAEEAALTTSEVASCSNCCYEENNSYSNEQQHSLHPNINSNSQPLNEVTPMTNNLSLICDIQNELENDISNSIDFSTCQQVTNMTSYFTNTNQSNGLNMSHIQVMDNAMSNVILNGLHDEAPYTMNNNALISQCPPPQFLPPTVFEEECFSSMRSFMQMNSSNPPLPPSCSWLDFSLRPLSNLNANALSVVGSNDVPAMFSGSNLLMGSESQTREMDFIGDNNGLICPDSLQRSFSNEVQAFCGEGSGQWMRPGGTNENNLPTEMPSLDEANYKVGKLSAEQRKEKIHRYLKKRNERNFSKKIKYACRKTLADSRPRVRGRFAKNDEYVGHNDHRSNYGHRDEDDDDDIHVKDEEDILDSDIFAHISGVNSFKFGNPIQSWM